MDDRWWDLYLDPGLGADLVPKSHEKSKFRHFRPNNLENYLLIIREHCHAIWKRSDAPKYVFRDHKCDEVPLGNSGIVWESQMGHQELGA